MFLFLGGVAALYLINPTMGVFELLPDNLPLVGNLDEGAAALLLLTALKHFGIDLPAILTGAGRRREPDRGDRGGSRLPDD